jgi:hypothetical protein
VAVQRIGGQNPGTAIAQLICTGEAIAAKFSALAELLGRFTGFELPTIPTGIELDGFEEWCREFGFSD